MLSLNQIKLKIVDYLKSHAQINEVIYGSDFDYSAENELTYPIAGVEYIDANINDKMINYNFRVKLVDLHDPNIEGGDDEVVSDMLLVATDFMGWLQQQEGFDFVRNVNIQNVTDEYGDRTSGVRFRMTLSVVRPSTGCGAPTKH
jgi:disulfide oxidoreductase YuzD